jgi:4-amino-4-deoxychorismate lyase
VRGVMRTIVLESASQLGLTAEEAELDLASFEQADEVFVTNAVFGVWPVKRLRDTVFQVGNFTKALQAMLGYANRA